MLYKFEYSILVKDSDIWFKLYCLLQDIAVDPEEDQKEGGEECEHSFVLKDDIGSVCHICGLVDKSIESIFEYKYPKVCFF